MLALLFYKPACCRHTRSIIGMGVKDCHFGAIGQMSGCITTETDRPYSKVVGGAVEKKI
jgi:hypothetical protein